MFGIGGGGNLGLFFGGFCFLLWLCTFEFSVDIFFNIGNLINNRQ